MGFIRNDTNNIILDAVLTDAGRRALSANDGSFNIVKFAMADDEVNYDIVRQFGRAVGREKIEKNTPIFEAQTNGNLALKFKAMSISNPNLIRLPSLSLTGEGVDSTASVVELGRTTTTRRRIHVTQTIQDESSIDVELRDQIFEVVVDSQFVELTSQVPDSIDQQRRALYLLTRDPGETAVGGSQLTLTLSVKSITDSQFNIYGTRSNKNVIKTYARITGIHSGAVKEFEIQITRTS
jgi:hypothetical protein